jgi:bifunctional oligoribonuclease and PAP phosphatase NrnA
MRRSDLAMPYKAVAQALQTANSIMITTHLNPDGDGIGSGLALLHALEAMGKTVQFLCPSRIASLYGFLPGFDRITVMSDESSARLLPAVDVIISCDCGDRKRLGAVMAAPRTTLINLDHHATNDRFGDLNLVDEGAESSGVVVSRLFVEMGIALDRRLAECLYTTIVFDTGRFMHSNTTAHTFRWTADLLETGIDASAINRSLTYTRSPHDLAVLRLALEHLTVDAQETSLAGIALPASKILAVGAPEDWGDVVDVPRSLQGNRIAYFVREQADRQSVRVSLRSSPPWEVSPVAELFGGGGRQAAGCTVPGDLKECMRVLLPRLREQVKAEPSID